MKPMNDKNKRTIKAAATLAAVVIVFYYLGYGVGALAGKIENMGLDTAALAQTLLHFITYQFPYVYLIFMLAVSAACFYNYGKAKQLYTGWDQEEEEVIDRAEYLLDKNALYSNVLLITDLFMIGLWIYASERIAPDMVFGEPVQILVLVMFFAGYVLTVVIQRMLVELIKKINPEKRGEVLELGFTKEWEGSFDEAQKLIQYKAAHRALSVVQALCMILWMVCLTGELAWNMGVEPLIFVTVIWLAAIVVYQLEAMRLEHKKGNRK